MGHAWLQLICGAQKLGRRAPPTVLHITSPGALLQARCKCLIFYPLPSPSFGFGQAIDFGLLAVGWRCAALQPEVENDRRRQRRGGGHRPPVHIKLHAHGALAPSSLHLRLLRSTAAEPLRRKLFSFSEFSLHVYGRLEHGPGKSYSTQLGFHQPGLNTTQKPRPTWHLGVHDLVGRLCFEDLKTVATEGLGALSTTPTIRFAIIRYLLLNRTLTRRRCRKASSVAASVGSKEGLRHRPRAWAWRLHFDRNAHHAAEACLTSPPIL